MSCAMENFLLLWFDNQSEQSWENFNHNRKNSKVIKEKGVNSHKSFVSRAKSIIRNLLTFGLRSNNPMNASGRPKSGKSLKLWRKHVSDLYISINENLIATLKQQQMFNRKQQENVDVFSILYSTKQTGEKGKLHV